MQITASTFTDPAMREGLQRYYEDKKADLYEAWKAREDTDLPREVRIRTGEGQFDTATLIPISAEKMIGALVDFDRWLEFQAESFTKPMHRLERPEVEARVQPDGLDAWHQQWQANMNDIRSFLLSLQEAE